MASKRKASEELDVLEAAASLSAEGGAVVKITPLGAGQEVGRSCIIVEYMGKRVMLDCGIHPGYSGLGSLPFLDEVELDQIDVALITHFHLDHCAAVPYLIGKTNFKGRLIMTHPTKAIFYTLLQDFVRVSAGSADEALYSEADLDAAMARAEVLDFDQTIDIDGIQVTAHRAGHVLGAAMFTVDIGGVRTLYTGDYSRVADRHLPGADTPHLRPDILIVESTYGVSRHLAREVREKRFLDKVVATLLRGGRVLLPIVALGRAQELLLMLDEHWSRNKALQQFPIYQASGIARKALTVFQTYIEMMNEDVKAAFQHVVKGAGQFETDGPFVVMATPSMLQSGLSRDLFEQWCENERNAVIICDFAVQGTLARDILSNPTTVLTKAGVRVPLRMSVDAISFSAHADYDQTSGFVAALQPPHVVLVHGEAGEMMRLRSALERASAASGVPRQLHTPKVVQSVSIPAAPRRAAHVVGRLAEGAPKAGDAVRGVLVSRGRRDLVMHPEDLPAFTKLNTGRVMHKQAIPFAKPFSALRLALEVMFEGVEGAGHLPVKTAPSRGGSSGGGSPSKEEQQQADAGPPGQQQQQQQQQQKQEQQQRDGDDFDEAVVVGDAVVVGYRRANPGLGFDSHAVVKWQGGAVGDMVADAVIAVILQAAGEPPAAAAAEGARAAALAAGDTQGALAAEMALCAALLRAQFGAEVEVDASSLEMRFEIDGTRLVVDHGNAKVSCDDEGLRGRVERALARVTQAMRPCVLDVEL
ncbi:Cleavage and polyadenylation specificity factor subunit 3 [Monoraphidium neglectum]|uniref:Cleavage and polyadenylation specificity factor subunit 3 n=1 Tax=Monoraphidium neglectum TaxID=145388 RepID=A0A0D2NTP6_9CHLO|nr:Cleavage and polyadenylation specificity factor subunit 3 [Monoraphidium neglectum]KIZ07536.1 Cleavage and polyadenylation specificity factor subunit 3 [Monoraphidium neglectum]|eukprot:XP_013906555.1 Cleavage and polyadenylation specificity factor subunit 3 [Monoraphidium neglectum]